MDFEAYLEGQLHGETILDMYEEGVSVAHPANIYPNDEVAQASFHYGRLAVLALQDYTVSMFGVLTKL